MNKSPQFIIPKLIPGDRICGATLIRLATDDDLSHPLIKNLVGFAWLCKGVIPEEPEKEQVVIFDHT